MSGQFMLEILQSCKLGCMNGKIEIYHVSYLHVLGYLEGVQNGMVVP